MGGAALSVREVVGKPIACAPTGEKLEDFETFHPDRLASRILATILARANGALYNR